MDSIVAGNDYMSVPTVVLVTVLRMYIIILKEHGIPKLCLRHQYISN